MNKNVPNIILYSDNDNFDILKKLSEITAKIQVGIDASLLREDVNQVIKQLLSLSIDYGFNGNVWHNYIALLIMTSENAFSRICERNENELSTICEFAENDIDNLYKLFDYDFTAIDEYFAFRCFELLNNYSGEKSNKHIKYLSTSERLSEFVINLEDSADFDGFYNAVIRFYKQYGAGEFGLNKTFRLNTDSDIVKLCPVNNMEKVSFDDIVGYDSQKQMLIDNTYAFICGKTANNVLLYGDSGTGKSSSIKAIINKFYDDGLRMIEVHKHQTSQLAELISKLKYRNYKFIIYMDDLSFEDNENEYKYLKAVIEGGVETKPDNVLIYATSNRRHLIRETWSDRSDASTRNDVHSGDTLEEKLSLAARFGLTIYFPKPARSEYIDIVKELALKAGINKTEKELEDGARMWEMHHGGISGRTAKQYITYLLAEK